MTVTNFSRFKYVIRYLNENGSEYAQDVTGLVLGTPPSLSTGMQGVENLFDFEMPNVTLKLRGDLTRNANGYNVREMCPVIIYQLQNGLSPRVRFVGFVNRDGIRRSEPKPNVFETEIFVTSYISALKELMLGTFDPAYRSGVGISDEALDEAWSVYIKKDQALPPGIVLQDGDNPLDHMVEIEIALTPSQFHDSNILSPGDTLTFEKKCLFDTRMLNGNLTDFIETKATGRWRSYVYNGATVAARWTGSVSEQDTAPALPTYWTILRSLFDIWSSCLDSATRYYQGFSFKNFPWPRFESSVDALPDMISPNTVELDVGLVWHYAYRRTGGRDILVVWRNQWEVEIYEIFNATSVVSLGTYSLPEECRSRDIFDTGAWWYFLWLFRHFSDATFGNLFYNVAHWNPDLPITPDHYRSPLLDSLGLPQTDPATYRSNHPDIRFWTNLSGDLPADNKIYLTWFTAIGVDSYPDLLDLSAWYTVEFDLSTHDFRGHWEARGDTVIMPLAKWWVRSDAEHPLLPKSPPWSPGDPYTSWEERIYWVPMNPDSVNDFVDEDHWSYQLQPAFSEVVGPWRATEGPWGQTFHTESCPTSQGSYVRLDSKLFFVGDVLLDKINFAFESTTIADIVKLVCILTNSVPTLDYIAEDVGPITLRFGLASRDVAPTTRHYLSTADVISHEDTTLQYINREQLPDITAEGLDLAVPHQTAITNFYQNDFFLRVFRMHDTVVSLYDSSFPAWVTQVNVGDELYGYPNAGDSLGVIESLEIEEFHLKISSRAFVKKNYTSMHNQDLQ
jgi:hypothetical protein